MRASWLVDDSRNRFWRAALLLPCSLAVCACSWSRFDDVTDNSPIVLLDKPGSMKAGFAPGVGHGFGFEVVRETLGTFRYNSIGSFVKGGAYRTYGWVDPAKDLVGIIFMQRTNGGGDVADEINSFMAMAAAAIER